jgi:hypothetical protein
LPVEIEKTGETFIAGIKEIVAVVVELNAGVKFVISVGLYD